MDGFVHHLYRMEYLQGCTVATRSISLQNSIQLQREVQSRMHEGCGCHEGSEVMCDLPEHEFAEAERKRRDDDIWNAAIEAAAVQCENDMGRFDTHDRIRALKRPVS